MAASASQQLFLDVEAAVLQVVRGNPQAVRLSLATILARGHLLLEDVPGVGKTTLARALAKVLGVGFSRVQFTADLLPSDLVGIPILDAREGTLRFKKGPLFTNVVLADEINRASPKTQSALLEAMADRSVSVDETTWELPKPFHVLATQNPVEHHGAYPLPESQLDRFLICLSLGYPPAADELNLLVSNTTSEGGLSSLATLLDAAQLAAAQEQVALITLNDVVGRYLLSIVEGTRRHPDIELPCSPRGSLAWASLVRALAFLDGRSFVSADDVKQTAGAVLGHRLGLRGAVGHSRKRVLAVVDEIVSSVPAPR
ncbi:MAG TPA: MoxR family ATPase [Myxococcota bacterium]